jgi:predicted dehydrogenase
MTQLRIGIVGCGEVSQIIHLPTLTQLHEQFEVTALCDVSPTALQTVGEQWRVAQRYANYHDLVAQANVDAVLVANPDSYHADVVQAAAAAGKHVLVEKPMCLTLREADAVSAAQQRAGVVVQVGFMRRYAPAFIEACRLLPTLGEVRLARVHDVIGYNHLIIQSTSRVVRAKDVPADAQQDSQARREARLQEAIGTTTPEFYRAYGLLLGLSSHDTSAMRELLGQPRGVLYAAQRNGGNYLTAAFDYGSYVCHFETGVDAIPRFDAHLEVFTQEHVLRVQYDTPYVRNLPIRLSLTESNGRGGVNERVELPAWGDAFVAEWQAFYRSVVEGQPVKTTPDDFREDLELYQAMIKLMQAGAA